MAEVFELAGLSEADGWLLFALADHADDQGGSIFPSVARLAHKTGWSPRTVQRALRRLVDRGMLIQVAEAHAQRPREYRLSFRGLARKHAFGPRKDASEGCHHTVTPDSAVTPDRAVSPEGCQKGGVSPERGDSIVSPRTVSKRTVSKPSEKKRPVETEWPDDFVLTPERRAAAVAVGCSDPDVAWEAWHQRCLAKGLRYVRWGAAWATWLAHHGKYGCPCQAHRAVALPATRPGGRMSVMDAARVVAARMAAKGET
jgi:hypothetical protein